MDAYTQQPIAGEAKVYIHRIANIIHIQPVPELFLPQLEFTEMKRLAGRELGAAIMQQRLAGKRPQPFVFLPRRLWESANPIPGLPPGPAIACPAGLTTRACHWLSEKSYAYEIVDTRPQLLPPAQFDRITGSIRDGQAEALATISVSDFGVCDMVTGYGKTFMFRAIAEMWPDVPIVIVVPRCSVMNTVYKYLENVPGLEVGRVGSNFFEPRRVTIVVSKSLPKLAGWADSVRVVLCDEVYMAGATDVSRNLTQFRYARMFGFADGPYTRSDGRNLVIESLFGPMLSSVSYAQGVDQKVITPVSILAVPIGPVGWSRIEHETRSDVNKRHAYWRHDGRNRAIAYVTRLGADRLGIKYEECQTLITCETTEHALHLKSYLPDFTVCHSGDLDAARCKQLIDHGFDEQSVTLRSKELKMLQDRFESGELKKVIATPVWSMGVNFAQLSLLIRADGLTSKVANIQLPGRLTRLYDGKHHGLVIDFIDEFSDWALQRSNKRIKLYTGRGWKIETHPIKLAMT